MTPREPDRFDKQAREVWRSCLHDGDSPSHEPIAAALRQAADEALNEAAHWLEEIARDYEGRKLRSEAMDEPDEAKYQEMMARAAWRCVKAVYELKSPAAAPAAEVKVNACQVDLRTDKDRECFDDVVQAATRVLRSEPVTPPYDKWAATRGIAAPPAPLLPRVLAALEDRGEGCHLPPGRARDLAAELRAYIAEMEGKT